jgi:hypothetical protein
MGATETTEYPPIAILSVDQIQALADRLYGRGVSTIPTTSSAERQDLILASRALRRLLAAYERASGRQLACIMLAGGC